DVQALFGLLSQNKLQPAIAETAGLEDVVEIHRKIDSAQIAGKAVLLCH
ncbi:MAG: D-arabinose 1-dehydrogenase-like Zn-dependent alcohol dehydrogenase, partial [Halioglobus sp.]